MFLDLTPFAGKKAAIEVEGLARGSHGLDLIGQADEIRGAENLYREKLRPQFHFTSRRGWNNDSNGLVFHKGLWHLYYQHNPYGVQWGNMHWGHAVSEDLVHWRELPIATVSAGVRRLGLLGQCGRGREQYERVRAGGRAGDCSRVHEHRAGRVHRLQQRRRADVRGVRGQSGGPARGAGPEGDLVRAGTALGDGAVPRGRGEEDDRVLYVAGPAGVGVCERDRRVLSSARRSSSWRCEGTAGERRWVLYAADGDYMIGAFDGRVFTPEGGRGRSRAGSGKQRFSYGNCFYASQTYNNVPAEDGRRVQIAWGRVETPGMPFNQMMLFPVELTLRRSGEGVRMFAEPVREIERLREKSLAWKEVEVSAGSDPVGAIEGELLHVRATLRPAGATRCGFAVRGHRGGVRRGGQNADVPGQDGPAVADRRRDPAGTARGSHVNRDLRQRRRSLHADGRDPPGGQQVIANPRRRRPGEDRIPRNPPPEVGLALICCDPSARNPNQATRPTCR